ncbi:hypothetical protein TEK04_12780 [Klenkia sp. LSe6-5]|uniref:Uncharacterized protein n=1 Tax=Klenkia sesuvii TaxID=3103137 RepID=A0ABU8DXN0_9ACTN
MTASAPASAAASTARVVSPEQARRSWPWSALQGVVFVVLAVLAVVVADTGVRLLVGGLGVLGVVRGVAALRAARAGQVDRSAAVAGAGAAWFGALAVGVAFFPPVVAAWACVVAVAAVLAGLVVRADRRARAGAAVAVAVAAFALGAVLAGPGWLAAAAVLAVAVAVLALGIASVLAALAARRLAAQPAPAAAGCAGCACSAGGCGSLPRD